MDPVFRQLLERTPLPCPVVDVGCGRGQTLILLSLAQPGLEGVGIDWDEHKVALARAVSRPWPLITFEQGDVRRATIPAAGAILLLDVLHYSPLAEQDALLSRLAEALTPGGVLFVRELDASRSWRATVNAWQEHFGKLVHLNRGATLCFRPAAQIVQRLQMAGLQVQVTPSSGDLPLANVLIEARRPLATAGDVTLAPRARASE